MDRVVVVLGGNAFAPSGGVLTMDGQVEFAHRVARQLLPLISANTQCLVSHGNGPQVGYILRRVEAALGQALSIVVVDALRAGHETDYYPGETNLRAADVLVVNKVGKAQPEVVAGLIDRVQRANPRATIITSDLEIEVDAPQQIAGRRVLVVEDGPTLTHGGMGFGAGFLAATRYEARELIDPRRTAVGSIAEAFEKYPHIGSVLPALGYSQRQCKELETTINAAAPEVIVDASPARIDRVLRTAIPIVRVRYRFQQVSGVPIMDFVNQALVK